MKEKTLLILFVLFVFLGTEAKQKETLEKVDIISMYNAIYGSTESRDQAITADITSHMLTISIHQNVGIAQIMIRDSNGAMVELGNILTSPETTCIYISECGYYRVDIVLSNGDIYYGYFTVRDGIII